MKVNQWNSQCEVYVDVDCRHLRSLFESQKHEYYQNRYQKHYGNTNYIHEDNTNNVSIASSLVGSYLSKVDPSQTSLSKIRTYFCTDVIDVLTKFKTEQQIQEQKLWIPPNYNGAITVRIHLVLIFITLIFLEVIELNRSEI